MENSWGQKLIESEKDVAVYPISNKPAWPCWVSETQVMSVKWCGIFPAPLKFVIYTYQYTPILQAAQRPEVGQVKRYRKANFHYMFSS